MCVVDVPVVEFVSVVVGGDDIQQQDVLGFGVETGHTELHLREHLSATTHGNAIELISS